MSATSPLRLNFASQSEFHFKRGTLSGIIRDVVREAMTECN